MAINEIIKNKFDFPLREISRFIIIALVIALSQMETGVVRAKVKGPEQFEPIELQGRIFQVVLENKNGVDYQKVVAFSSKVEGQKPGQSLWEFIPPLPEPQFIDANLEKDVQIQRVFFSCFRKNGKVIEICIDQPPYMAYKLDAKTGEVVGISPWRTTGTAK